MSLDVKLFEKEEFGQVRVVMQNGEPWFVASDIAKALGYERPADAVNAHCKKANKITQYCDSPNRAKTPPININIIPESDVYRLVMRSNLPSAEKFQDWVVEEVLPTLRKTGTYTMSVPNFSNPAEAARAWADEYERAQKLAIENDELRTTKDTLEIALGDNRDWKAVTAIPWLKNYFRDASVQTCSRVGKYLTGLSKYMGYEVRKAEDGRWGSVNVYNIIVIDRMKRALDEDDKLLADIRK